MPRRPRQLQASSTRTATSFGNSLVYSGLDLRLRIDNIKLEFGRNLLLRVIYRDFIQVFI